MPPRELARYRNAAPAAELEDVGAVVQSRIEVAHPLERGAFHLSGPLRVAQRDRVVPARDDLLGIACDGPTYHLPHARRVTRSARVCATSARRRRRWPGRNRCTS